VGEHEEDTPVAKRGYTEEQILRALRQAEGGTRVADICREHIELCGATAKAHKWGNADLLPGVNVNRDAMARTTQLVQEGFVKITE
jgi:hypothetical protein